MDEQQALQQGAVTPDEIAGVWDAIYEEYDIIKVTPAVSQLLVENCGTGIDSVNTFNISSHQNVTTWQAVADLLYPQSPMK